MQEPFKGLKQLIIRELVSNSVVLHYNIQGWLKE